MIKTLIIPLLLCIVLVEYLTFRGFVKSKKRASKVVYWVFSAFVMTSFVTSALYAFATTNPLAMALMTWAVLLMILNFIVKLVFAIATVINMIAKRKLRWVTTAATALSALIMGMILHSVIYGRNDIRVKEVTIESDEIPESFNGYRIAQFSDAHLGNLMFTNVVENMVEKINDLNVNLVVQSGDLVNIHYLELTPEYIELLSKIKARDGVVSVLGNHDLGFYLADTVEMSPYRTVRGIKNVQRNDLGWTLLENENIVLRRGGDSIVIAGVTYPKNMNHNNYNASFGGSDLQKAMAGIKDSTFSIMVSHTPKLFDSVPSVVRPDLMLSGHVHSMQIQFNIGGWKWSPAKWMYNMYSGLYHNGEYQLYINDGLGYVLFPVRFGTRPEITLITLKHKK